MTKKPKNCLEDMWVVGREEMWVAGRDEYTINIPDTTCYIGLNWRKFADELPKDNARILVCGKINTDPLERPKHNPIYMKFVDFYQDEIIDELEDVYSPNPEDYWIYQDEIPTP